MTASAPGTTPPSDLRPRGLDDIEAARRLARHGPNRIRSAPGVPLWSRVAVQLRDPLIMVLLAAVALTLAIGDHPDAVVITLVIVVNTTVGVIQEIRAENAVAALSAMTAPTARVLRTGTERAVPSAVVVPGDVVLLGEGDIVPADAVLEQASALLVDESMLTGESVPVDKDVHGARSDARRVQAGTVVVRGRAVGTVTATGANSALGRIAALLQPRAEPTPLQRRLADLGKVLALVAVCLCVVVFALGLARGQPPAVMGVTAISLAVAAVPESLPAVVTLALALGARRMAARNAVVRRLPAVETLGSVTVLATDKTGTLTEGRMVVEQVWTPHGTATLTGGGYEPLGEILVGGHPAEPADLRPVQDLLAVAALCNDAVLRPPGQGARDRDGRWTALGDPTEAALLAAAVKGGCDHDQLLRERPRCGEAPFDSIRKRMTTLHREPSGEVQVCLKGAPETVLDTALLDEPPHLLERARREAGRLAADGYRVLAVATAHRPEPPTQVEDAETGLRLLGLTAISDPPRRAVPATLAACHRAGITTVLITGYHPATAHALAVRAGLLDADAPRADVVTGPALRQADIGVAMGRRGTEVARQAADLVLADDELTSVVAAVEEGRRVYDNIRRFLVYGLAGGAAETLVMLLGPAVGLALPLRAGQILWINLLTHGLTGVATGAEPVSPHTMSRPPRPPHEHVLGAGLWQHVLMLGAVVTAASLAAGIWAHETGRPWQSVLFVALLAAQLGVVLGLRDRLFTRLSTRSGRRAGRAAG
ncbi:cation-translocating P-type ATPase [Kitasatospora sp. NPDC049258]|uniref:cation-translocating P-type ATPase n=1 Tax=Kitasatospora sp. NPDC049258 TaxID=3155394 RepID=UPI003435E5B0